MVCGSLGWFAVLCGKSTVPYRSDIVSIVALLLSHRGQVTESFDREAATLLLRSARSCYALFALATTSLRPTHFRGDYVI